MPMRGKSNKPSYVKYTAEFLSNFYNISFDKLVEITDNNFYKLFSKAKRYNKFQWRLEYWDEEVLLGHL